jgi:hypothetical protein
LVVFVKNLIYYVVSGIKGESAVPTQPALFSNMRLRKWNYSMNATIKLIIDSLGIGILISIPTVLLQLWLKKEGWIRDGVGFIIIGVFGCVLIKQIWFSEMSWICLGPLIVIGGLMSMNRGDLWEAMRRGRWWWKSEI